PIRAAQTSGVSPLILASMDAARRTFALRGEELLERTLELARRARSVINEIPRLRVMGREVLGRPGAHYLDETKLVIDLHALDINGYDACDWLRTEQKLTVELADHRRVLALITIGDNDETIQRLIDALAAL